MGSAKSEIVRATEEYVALKKEIQALNRDIPISLQRKESALVARIIAASALDGTDIACKAAVLLDWIEGTDTVAELTESLCRDAIRVFPPDSVTP